MSHHEKYGRRRDLTIYLLHNNTEAICTPIFRKGVCHTAATEADKKQ